jgi:D-sedoheptulose 7-phosphate isomerase
VTKAAASAAARIAERDRVLGAFLGAEQHRLALACLDLARAFHRGGLLIPFGEGAAASDAAHVAVEFMHPVIVGKPALPAVSPASDPARALSLERIGRAGDVALGLAHRPRDPAVTSFLARAGDRGLLTIALTAGETIDADHAFAVPSDDPTIVQEAQETTYHVLWELVHVFFEHPSLLEEACLTCGDVAVQARVVAVDGATAVVERDGAREQVAVDLVDGVAPGTLLLCHAGVALDRVDSEAGAPEDPSGFLYPFLGGGGSDADTVLADVAASTVRKGADTIALRRGIDIDAVAECADAIRAALAGGGRLLAFGNGGSATDAQDAAFDALQAGWPALALVNDPSTITALGNDVGFENAFARQLIPLGRPGDVALAFSTSGSSPSIIAGLEEAHRRGMVTCALTGYGGGRLAELPYLDHLLTVSGDYVPRIQEVHATIWHLLSEAVGTP